MYARELLSACAIASKVHHCHRANLAETVREWRKEKSSLIVGAQILIVGNWLNLIPVSSATYRRTSVIRALVCRVSCRHTCNSISIFLLQFNEIISVPGSVNTAAVETVEGRGTGMDICTILYVQIAEVRGNSTEIRDS